uniref:Uncharacterized protein n=1 Tax=Hyaloperonospora arabidopsidis (strain Emoy2) TaxID=559515 RepID=M4B2P6_HYAAE
MVGQDAILGMDFIVPAVIRLDLADETLCLPNEVRIQLSGQRWVTTTTRRIGCQQLLKVTNVILHTLILHDDTERGLWLTKDKVRRTQGFVSIGSRRYAEWLNLAYEATTDQVYPQVDLEEGDETPLAETPRYKIPSRMLQRSKTPVSMMNVSHQPRPERKEQSCGVKVPLQEETPQGRSSPKDNPPGAIAVDEEGAEVNESPRNDENVCTFESGDLWAEDIIRVWAIIPEVDPSSESIGLKDIQIPDPDGNTLEEVDRLRQIIWKRRHLLVEKGIA